MSHDHRVVVITGASAGVGRATACAFARRGASIGLIARGRAGLGGAKRDVESLGGRAMTFAADVTAADRIEAAAADIERELGPIDVWVNNAMASVVSPIKETTADEFKRVTEVTYLGVVHGTLAALRRMLVGNKVPPALGDWYLARNGYGSQQTVRTRIPIGRSICGTRWTTSAISARTDASIRPRTAGAGRRG